MGGVSFNYSLFCGIEIDKHSDFIENNPFDAFKEVICLEISIDGEVLILDEEEWKTFYGLVCKSINEIFVNEVKSCTSCAVETVSTPLFRLTREIVFSDNPLKVLARPKFRCNVLTDVEIEMKDGKSN